MSALFFLLGISLQSAAAVEKTPVVTLRKAALEEVSDLLTYPARIESKISSTIFAEADGVVTSILSPLGAKVNRHARILIIKHTDPVFQYAPMTLTSAVSGVVSEINVTEGSGVTKGQALATVTDPGQIRLKIEVPALDLPFLKSGMRGGIVIKDLLPSDAGDDKDAVVVKGISPLVDKATGTAAAELELAKTAKNTKALSKRLIPGSVADVTFKVNKRNAFILPEQSVVYRGNETFVRIVQNGIAKKIAVTLGKRQRGMVEILKGIKEGAQIVDRASGFITDGEKVQVEQ